MDVLCFLIKTNRTKSVFCLFQKAKSCIHVPRCCTADVPMLRPAYFKNGTKQKGINALFGHVALVLILLIFNNCSMSKTNVCYRAAVSKLLDVRATLGL